MIYRYINLDDREIFVKKLISESPTTKNEGIAITTLEKLLVDIYKDPEVYERVKAVGLIENYIVEELVREYQR